MKLKILKELTENLEDAEVFHVSVRQPIKELIELAERKGYRKVVFDAETRRFYGVR